MSEHHVVGGLHHIGVYRWRYLRGYLTNARSSAVKSARASMWAGRLGDCQATQLAFTSILKNREVALDTSKALMFIGKGMLTRHRFGQLIEVGECRHLDRLCPTDFMLPGYMILRHLDYLPKRLDLGPRQERLSTIQSKHSYVPNKQVRRFILSSASSDRSSWSSPGENLEGVVGQASIMSDG